MLVAEKDQGKAELHLSWLDYDGVEKPYGVVEPRSRRSIRTFAGHLWRLRDGDGRCIGAVRATDTDSRVLLP